LLSPRSEAVVKVATGEGATTDAELRGLDHQTQPECQQSAFRHPWRRLQRTAYGVDAGGHHPEDPQHLRKPKLLAYVASVAGCDIQTATAGAAGLRRQGLRCRRRRSADLLPYFQQEGTTSPALEFVSPIKGPNLEQITVEVGSGIRPAAEAAALYDEDVRKQAMQLGLPGWN
jgi:hypothetical protein